MGECRGDNSLVSDGTALSAGGSRRLGKFVGAGHLRSSRIDRLAAEAGFVAIPA